MSDLESRRIVHYSSSENKGTDQLLGYREADLRLCFRIYMQKKTNGFLITRLMLSNLLIFTA